MRKTKGRGLDPQNKNRGDANLSSSGRSHRRPLPQPECQCAGCRKLKMDWSVMDVFSKAIPKLAAIQLAWLVGMVNSHVCGRLTGDTPLDGDRSGDRRFAQCISLNKPPKSI
jgi:hypothetical protein